jgi:poly(3-hydroxybutyrate) depolymerase
MAFHSPFAPATRRRVGVAALVAAVVSLAPQIAAVAQPPAPAPPAGETGFVRRTFRDAAGEHGYVVYVPRDYTPDRDWPVILFLHGAGERGTDGFRQTEYGLGPLIRRWGDFPWIVVFPQAEDQRGPILRVWAPDAPDGKRALAILDEVEHTYHTDPHRRVLTGWSMGGRGTYMLAAAYPEKWTAAVPVSGWADIELAPGLAKVPLWAFHGTSDTLVSFEEDKALIQAVRDAGGHAWLTALPGEGHYIWRSVYASPNLFEWMRDPSRFAGQAEPPALNPRPDVELSREEANGPFVPCLELDNAVAIRVGPDTFRDLSEAATKELAEKPLTGSMPGTSTESKQAGITFKVHTSRMSYRVPVTKAEVTPTERGTLRFRV